MNRYEDDAMMQDETEALDQQLVTGHVRSTSDQPVMESAGNNSGCDEEAGVGGDCTSAVVPESDSTPPSSSPKKTKKKKNEKKEKKGKKDKKSKKASDNKTDDRADEKNKGVDAVSIAAAESVATVEKSGKMNPDGGTVAAVTEEVLFQGKNVGKRRALTKGRTKSPKGGGVARTRTTRNSTASTTLGAVADQGAAVAVGGIRAAKDDDYDDYDDDDDNEDDGEDVLQERIEDRRIALVTGRTTASPSSEDGGGADLTTLTRSQARTFMTPGAVAVPGTASVGDHWERRIAMHESQYSQAHWPAGMPPLESSISVNLVEASLVEERSTADIESTAAGNPIVEAKLVEQTCWQKRMILYTLLLLLMMSIVVAAVGLGVGLKRWNSEGVEPATSSPTAVPMIPLPLIKGFSEMLPNYTLNALQNTSSPQYKAYTWLQQDLQQIGNYTNINATRRFALELGRYDVAIAMERFALATLYYATGGEGWTQQDGWLTLNNVCAWYHDKEIDSSCMDGVFKGISLLENNLMGSLPLEIALLTSLTNLLIRENTGLVGPIPTTIGELSLVTHLDLYRNSLTGSIPVQLANMLLLEWIDMDENNLEGTLPVNLSQMTMLKRIYLSENKFVKTIPSEYSQLMNLEDFRASENQLTGSLPPSFSELTGLTNLDLSENSLQGPFGDEFLKQWPTSLSFEIADNEFMGTLSSYIGAMSQLTLLDFSGNEFMGALPTELGQLAALKWLYLDNNFLNGTIPDSFGSLTMLQTLGLLGNEMSGSMPTGVCFLMKSNQLRVYVNCERVACDCGCMCNKTDADYRRTRYI